LTCIVVDASVTLSWCFPDEQTDGSISVLDRLKTGERALVPAFWALEVLNSLLVGERRGRITAEQTREFFDTLRILRPILDYTSLEQVAGPVQIICRDHRLTPYDALYIELALRSGCPLATLDQPQRQAASSLGVQCL
jgi:predicted nucleic acid-binding protein